METIMKRTPEINHLISSLESSILVMRRCWRAVKSKELAKDLSLMMKRAREDIDHAKGDPAPTTGEPSEEQIERIAELTVTAIDAALPDIVTRIERIENQAMLMNSKTADVVSKLQTRIRDLEDRA